MNMHDEYGEPVESGFAEATPTPTEAQIEFHISMRPYAQQDMERAIIDAAASQVLDNFGPTALAKGIEAKCVELLNAKATAALAGVTDSIIDQPLTPAFGDKKPVTMREFIGLVGREYLTERVDREGKPQQGGWGSSNSFTRVELLVTNFMQKNFKQEIEKATSAAIAEVQTAIRTAHADFLTKEKQRLREALAKLSA